MSAEGATALYERISSDQGFQARLEAAEIPDDRRRIVTEACYDVSRDDLPTVRKLAGVSELSDEDLEMVAGGKGANPTAVGVGMGVVSFAAIAAALVGLLPRRAFWGAVLSSVLGPEAAMTIRAEIHTS